MSEVPATGGAPGESGDGPDPRVGTTLDGRYHLLRKLGSGGFGAVYEAEHVLIKRKVAVKVLHAHVAADVDMIARFKREAIAATATGHPHIVEVMDLGRTPDGGAYMVLELLSGSDWAARLETEGAQPIGRTVRIVRQVLDGLEAAHDKGIVHRDLKAENVFLITKDDDPDFVKIVDFGISKMREEGQPADSGVTHTGMALGTPAAMAPEQFQGKKDVDHRADLWAVGVMLYRALAGRWPFDGETYAMLAVDVMTGEPPSLTQLRGDVPPGLSAIVERLLKKNREDRFTTAREVRAALTPYERGGDARDTIDVLGATHAAAAIAAPTPERSAAPATPGAPAAPTSPSRLPLLLGALGLAGLAGASLLFTLSPSDTPGASEGAPDTARVAAPPVERPIDAPTPAEPGRVFVLTTPPGCLVSEDGEALGLSPLDVELPAGPHALTIECPAEGLRGRTEVTVEAGHTARTVVALAPDAGRPRPGRRAGHGETEVPEPEHPEETGGTTPEPDPTPETEPVVVPPPERRPDAGRSGFIRPGHR